MRPRLTYANAVSTLALFVALGGAGAYAAQQLAPRSVGERQLRPGAVTADRLRKNAVTVPKIEALAVKNGKLANGAVSASKLGNGAVTTDKLDAGAVTGEKVANDAITGEKVDEASLGRVPSAKTADSAVTAESANPAAFAKVDSEGNVNSALSKGIGNADVHPAKEAGIYCVTVPAFSPRGALVTPEYTVSGAVTVFVKIGGAPECAVPGVELQRRQPGQGALLHRALQVGVHAGSMEVKCFTDGRA